MPATTVRKFDNLGLRDNAVAATTIQTNNTITDVEVLRQALSLDVLYHWFGVPVNSGTTPMSRGSTDTNLGTSALVGAIAGVPFTKAAVTAGTALGALGTIAASKWGIIAVDVVAAGTLSFSVPSGYAAGYATEALAIAALPPRLTAKVRLGYITILASASTFVTGTDALAGGATGNPATTTNYYPQAGILAPTGTEKTGGANGILISPGLAIGSTDTRVSSLAFTYNANGLTNIPKAAVAAGTTFGALGTIPADTWGVIALNIDAAGTVTYQSAPKNYSTGYGTEAAAIADVNDTVMPVPSGKCRMGYVTIKTKVGSAFIVATDSLAGGASGNVASATNYYSQAGITLASGTVAAKIANASGTVITA